MTYWKILVLTRNEQEQKVTNKHTQSIKVCTSLSVL